MKLLVSVAALFSVPALSWAGLYYSGETFAELPSHWRGFLLDQRTLRNIALPGGPLDPPSPARLRYLEEAAKLQSKTERTADELADLGALYVRLGQIDKALPLLREAQRRHPNHFTIAANLGTAWQLQGDLAQAALALQDAVRLAPGKYQQAEEHHLKLVRGRMHNKQSGFDDLFGVHFVGDKGKFEPGRLAAAERQKLPKRAVAIAQQLALWLPADGRLLWQLAELASAHGDVKNAAAMMDGCVTTFGMGDAELRRRRQQLRAAADALAKESSKVPHEGKHLPIAFRSQRPLLSKIRLDTLPPISATGVNLLPWEVINETTVDSKFKPTFPQYLRDLASKEVSMTGFMQPLGEDPEFAAFMFIEFPVGCWFCEMPETNGIVFVELPAGRTTFFTRGLRRITGRLALNADNPEDFLYAIRDARITGVD